MKMRKGFTLVELLIVIIIIGILAAAMLLSSSSATDSAVATKIISNLRSMKAAALMYRSDNQGAAPASEADLKKYFGDTDLSVGYTYANGLVKYTDAQATEMTAKVQTKLAEAAAKHKNLFNDTGDALYTAGGTSITMKAD